ncbi:DUF3850 domain-containing protein [Candidatus Microgenomates bacterium]|nr:MAG: DUF3850 domain-containing protein [Candidatus Microgenomates bacterium]
MARIEKKILPQYYDAVASGKKKYELRLADWDCKEGDILVLREWNLDKNKYTGRQIEKKVSYVAKFKINDLFWPREEIEKHGIQVISLE